MAARIPPQNLEAEKAILGSLMLDKDAWDKVVDQVDESDFYKPAHQKLFAVIRDLNHTRYPVDLITVSDALRTQGDLESVGGTDTLVDLVNSVISSVNIEAHSKLVKEKSTLRRMISAGSE
ncbi:MAG: DnaB-like helicase N-terminal domain-containing protein, partial [bacterium]